MSLIPEKVTVSFMGAISHPLAESALNEIFSNASITAEDLQANPDIPLIPPFKTEINTGLNGKPIMKAFLDAVYELKDKNEAQAYPASGSNWSIICEYKNGREKNIHFIRNDYLMLFP